LPADVVGTQIYNVKENDFSIKKGPVFANFVLADEINRAPAKVQSALLEVMQEKQVTIGDETMKLPTPFWFWQRKILLIKKELIFCQKHKPIVLC
jgi:MoxR-like ATPase